MSKAAAPNEEPSIDDEKEVHDPHEDDDYPSCMMATPVKTEEGGGDGGKESSASPKEKKVEKQRSIEEELTFLKRVSCTRWQVGIGKLI